MLFKAPPWYLFIFMFVSKKIITPKNTPKHPNDEVCSIVVFAHIAPSCGVYLRVFDLGTHINKGQMGWKGGLPWLPLVLRKEPMGTDQTEWWRA